MGTEYYEVICEDETKQRSSLESANKLANQLLANYPDARVSIVKITTTVVKQWNA
jgi:hypothetical protein